MTRDNELLSESLEIVPGTPFRPVRKLANPTVAANSNIAHSTAVQASSTAAAAAKAVGTRTNVPQLLFVSATESPSRQNDRVYSEVSVSFTRDPADTSFLGVRIWFTNYHSNTGAVIMAEGNASPITFLCETTNETVTVIAQAVDADGSASDFDHCRTCTVLLDGVVSAPPAPNISQPLVGTPTGYQFGFYQVVLSAGTEDVIACYRVYRGVANTFGSSSLRATIAPDGTNAGGSITFTDNLNDAVGATYYYWVTAVNTMGLESTPTPAQSGTVMGSIGSIPASLSTPFKVATTTTTTTFTTSPSCYFTRADGSVTIIGSSSTAITGLVSGNTCYYFPYWRESDQTLQWVGAADVNIPTIVGATCAAASSQWVQTTTNASIPASFSFEMWVKGSVAANQAIMSYSAPGDTGTLTAKVMQAYVSSAGEVVFSIWNGTSWQTLTTAGASVLDGSWHHIVCTYDPSASSGTTTVYVDSAYTSDDTNYWQKTSVGTVASTSGYWHIGFAKGTTGAPLTADTYNSFTLSSVAVYDACLTTAAVGAHFQSFINLNANYYDAEISYDNAIYYWKLNETSSVPAADSRGSNTGTYHGGLTLNQSSPVITVLGTPQIAFPYVTINAMQQQFLRTHTPLANGAIGAKNVAAYNSTGGSGGGSKGGGGGIKGGCFSGNVRVKTPTGYVAFQDFPEDTTFQIENETGIHDARLIVHPNWHEEMIDMGGGELVTFGHHIRYTYGSKMKPAIYWFGGRRTVDFTGTVYNLSIITDDDASRHYVLENGIIASNIGKIYTY